MFANTLTTTTDKPILGADVFVFSGGWEWATSSHVGVTRGDLLGREDSDIVWALNTFARSFIEQFSRE